MKNYVNLEINLASGTLESIDFDLSNQRQASAFNSWLQAALADGLDLQISFSDVQSNLE